MSPFPIYIATYRNTNSNMVHQTATICKSLISKVNLDMISTKHTHKYLLYGYTLRSYFLKPLFTLNKDYNKMLSFLPTLSKMFKFTPRLAVMLISSIICFRHISIELNFFRFSLESV